MREELSIFGTENIQCVCKTIFLLLLLGLNIFLFFYFTKFPQYKAQDTLKVELNIVDLY